MAIQFHALAGSLHQSAPMRARAAQTTGPAGGFATLLSAAASADRSSPTLTTTSLSGLVAASAAQLAAAGAASGAVASAPVSAIPMAAPAASPATPSPFGSSPWLANPYGIAPDGTTFNYNPIYFATPQTAAIVAQMVGGKVVESNQLTSAPGSPFHQGQPTQMVELPNGGLINPGLIASFYSHGYPKATVDQMVAQEVAAAQPVGA